MVTDWVATKLLKNRVHDVMAQKVVHDVVALITYSFDRAHYLHDISRHIAADLFCHRADCISYSHGGQHWFRAIVH